MSFHNLHLLSFRGKLQETTRTVDCSAQTRCGFVFFLAFGYTAVVEAQLFAKEDAFRCEHSYAIHIVVLLNFDDCLAVWTAAVTQPRRVVTIEYGVNHQDVVA